MEVLGVKWLWRTLESVEVALSLRPQPLPSVPAEIVHIAYAAFPKGHPYLALADALDLLFTDEQFAPLYPLLGQPALAPWRLALVTILQFAENLSNRQAAAAVRALRPAVRWCTGWYGTQVGRYAGGPRQWSC